MLEFRQAKKGEINRQKEIWKICFGDPDKYIDFYFANRYKEQETLLLLHNEAIAAMLTMLPVKTVTPKKRMFNTAMLYAIATHPREQNKGFSTRLMDYSNQCLMASDRVLSILVPAEEQLFAFYRQRGYQNGFYIREIPLNQDIIAGLSISKPCQCTISPISPEEYNQRRNKQLCNRLYIAYADEDIAYQKKLSQLSGADLYGIDGENIQGCAAVERVNSDKVLIKEMLVPDEVLNEAIKRIAQHLKAKELILRTPAYLAEHLGGTIRPFGMVRILKDIDLKITAEQLGYLGFAFD
ncbi:GNAT family N-acetyltransferase [Desulfotomaculum sp. 1211_IL3151]|uniref:GNAT family N-acetyltransferase n=1 Tax=Desulfotomaculum sp. 1211_IL3151 TaxID=3084055 RepID=UPI002FDA80F0